MLTTRCCTQRKIYPVVVEAADKSKTDSSSAPSESRGSQSSTGNRQAKVETECWYCGWKGHRESECWKKHIDSDKSGSGSGSGRTRQGNRQRSHYVEGSEGAENGSGPAFVMKHKANWMKSSTSKLNELWYVDSGASNHMTSHEVWFSYL